jgi:methylated-DNA-[protein]-cysteine S-methyltransferase
MNNKILINDFKSPIGDLLIGVYKDQLCLLDYTYRKQRKRIDQRLQAHFKADYQKDTHPLMKKVKEDILAYLAGDLQEFNLPLLTAGTPFQQKVWDALLEIPYGERLTYLELAQKLGDVKAVRAVAGANGANAISIIIPCHRVVASNGGLGGYAGGLTIKKKLLLLEQQNAPGSPVQGRLF